METPISQITNRHPRIMGIVILALGLALAKWQIYDPLHAAEQHKQNVQLYTELVALAVLVPTYGILLVVFGTKPKEWLKIDPQNLSVKNILILLSIAAVCIAVLFFVLGELTRQGYVMKF